MGQFVRKKAKGKFWREVGEGHILMSKEKKNVRQLKMFDHLLSEGRENLTKDDFVVLRGNGKKS